MRSGARRTSVIHIVTVHWNSEKWIQIQQRYLDENVTGPYRLYGWLNGVDEKNYEHFAYVCAEPVKSHAVKLNILADIAGASAADDDILIFIDGDAFPITDIAPLLRDVPRHKLIAVQRRENNVDIQPHPCFCATTVGFWRSIGGDWKSGHEWRDEFGKPVTDVGGNLLGLLEAHRVDWLPLLRTNRWNPHPLFFGIYADAVYHHGAGFRRPWSRRDINANIAARAARKIAAAPVVSRLTKVVPHRYRALVNDAVSATTVRANEDLADDVYTWIVEDPAFFRRFM
jgi:hypothetical protein